MTASYSSLILSRNPIAYWRLGELGGSIAVDASGNGHNGIYHGNPTFGQPGAIADDPDTCVQFQGADYVEIPDSAAFSQPSYLTTGLTVEAWMRPDVLAFPGESTPGSDQNPYVHWLGKGIKDQEEWAFRIYSNEPSQATKARPNRTSAYIWSPTGKEGAGAHVQENLTAGEWIHIVGCYQPGDQNTLPPAGVLLYKNGVLKDSPPNPGTLYSNPLFAVMPAHGTAPLRIGTRDFASFFIGALDEVAIYPCLLTPDKILENYLAGVD